MNSKRLVAWVRDRKAEIRQAMTAAGSEPSPTSCPEWYAGLVVSPASFSRQLGDMQLSLMRANNSAPQQQTQGRNQAEEPVAAIQHRI
jgi:hypothetical protein